MLAQREHHKEDREHSYIVLYRVFYLKRNLNYFTEPLHARNDETNGNIEFLQPYPVVAADALLEISTAVISSGLSLDEHLSKKNTSCVPKFCYQSVYCFLFCTCLSEYIFHITYAKFIRVMFSK
jgi:hypothetical protein